MDYQVFLIGLLVLAIFLAPIIYVVRSSKNSEKHDAEINQDISAKPADDKKTRTKK